MVQKRVLKRSFSVVEDLFSTFISDNHNNDNSLKVALYNSLAIVFVLLAIISLFGVYLILQPFIKPLLWALICGSALHPFKLKIANGYNNYITKLQLSSRPLTVNVSFLPFNVILKLSDKLGNFLFNNVTPIVLFITILFTGTGLYLYTPKFILRLCFLLAESHQYLLYKILEFFNSTLIVGSIILCYIGVLLFLWHPQYHLMFLLLSSIVWVAIIAWISNFFAYFNALFFLCCQSYICASYCFILFGKYCRSENKSQPNEEIKLEDGKNKELPSLVYIRWLSVLCAGLIAINIPAVPYIATVLLTVYFIKQCCFHFGITELSQAYFNLFQTKLFIWYSEREKVLMPPTLNLFVQMLSGIRMKFLNSIKDYCNSVASIAVILGLLIVGTFFSVFLLIQAYREGAFLVQAGSKFINLTVVQNPEINHMLPDNWRSTVDETLNNAYVFVRDTISTTMQSFLKEKGIDTEKSAEIEKGALELWDRVYQAWVMPFQPTTGPTTVIVTPDAVFTACTNFVDRLKKAPEVISQSILEENVSTLKTGFHSIFDILWGNMSLILNVLMTLISLIFGGGMSLINFSFQWVVFLTALFYLLSSSRETYIPVEMITDMSPKYGKRFALAIQMSCSEVLAASFKLSVFYGLWTWLNHFVFMSNLIYLPAVFAAILGVIPVLGTYWACVPAVFDLWFLQDSKLRALGLFLAQVFPTAIVETTVYNEIKGSGHPYLTGLSVAGGLFWLGIEGAIAGPVLLCLVFTVLNILSTTESID